MGRPGWRIERGRDGTVVVRSALLDTARGVGHAFSVRSEAGTSGLLQAIGLGSRQRLAPRQVHGARVVTADDWRGEAPQADAVLALRRDGGESAPSVRTADCVPLLIAERDGGAVAAVHSGWRGTEKEIAGAAVRALVRSGCEPARLVAAIGPAIGPCCYQVGAEVARAVTGLDTPRIDLPAAVSAQLIRAGIPAPSVSTAPWCTRCSVEPSFHSYRRDGQAAGRSLAVIGWVP